MTYPGEDAEAPADVFVGTLAAGLREGKGKYTFASGASFDGEYAANQRQGMGTMLYADGGKYAGEWAKDKFHGAGTYTYPSGDIYSGNWEDGKKHGAGSYIHGVQIHVRRALDKWGLQGGEVDSEGRHDLRGTVRERAAGREGQVHVCSCQHHPGGQLL